jgi:cholesterol transport system auxiliary component
MSQNIFPRMSRRHLLAAGASVFALTGCEGLIGPPEAPHLYLLKPPARSPVPGPSVAWQLAIAMPAAAENLDSDRIALIQSDATFDYYAGAAWPDRLPRLVQDALVEAFENSGRIISVARDTEGLRADYRLQTDLRDFETRYDQPDGIPTAVVRIHAKLVAAAARSIATDITAEKEVRAEENSVAAAVRAMDTAFAAALAQIVDWALAMPMPKAS